MRAFNASYNYFDGADPAAIVEDVAAPGWERATRAFASNAYAGAFRDPLGAMQDRFGADVLGAPGARGGQLLDAADKKALRDLELDENAGWKDIRARYKRLIRTFHPDTNGGDRAHEAKLRRAIDAYTQLRDSPAFGKNKD